MKIVATSVAPLLKEHRFRKQRLTFHRRRGDVTQVVNVQISHGGRRFYVNVGIMCDAISALGASTTGNLVIGPYSTHHAWRLDDLASGLPPSWCDDDETAGIQIRSGLVTALAKLDRLDSAAAMLAELDLSEGFNKVLRAQLKWIAGDRAGSRADLEAVAREYDRQGCSVVELARRAGIKQRN
jgi:hypothetical protein